MATLIPSYHKRSGLLPDQKEICGICINPFSESSRQGTQGELRYNHTVNHDGFHKKCLKSWLRHQENCPIDKAQLDPASIFTQRNWVRRRVDLASKAAVNAALCGVGVGIVKLGLIGALFGTLTLIEAFEENFSKGVFKPTEMGLVTGAVVSVLTSTFVAVPLTLLRLRLEAISPFQKENIGLGVLMGTTSSVILMAIKTQSTTQVILCAVTGVPLFSAASAGVVTFLRV